jgi:hypothetical protein
VKIAEVVDQESLQAYLEGLEGDAGLLTARRLAFFVVISVAPVALLFFAGKPSYRNRNLTPLAVFGACTISLVTSKIVTPGIVFAAAADDAAAAAYAAHASAADADASFAAAASFAAYASAASYASYAYASAAAAATHAAAAATHASSADADFWGDLRAFLTGQHTAPDAPMPAITLDAIRVEDWKQTCILLKSDSAVDWTFWITWFDRVLAGKDIHADMLAPILNGLTKGDWLGDPAKVNPLFDEVLAVYQVEDEGPPLIASTPVEFSFDDLARVMRMIGIDSSLKHLREPSVVQSFLDDAEEVRDGLQDFVDDAKELQGGNYAGVLRRRAEKLLAEFDRAADKTHLRAERVVLLAQELETYAKHEKAANDLGPDLDRVLESRIGGLKKLCRQHFGPAYLTLAPLSQLNFDQVDQAEVIAVFDRAITWLETLPAADHVPLDAEGMAVFRDMQRELHDYRAAIGEASTDEFRAMLEERFAAQSGAMGLSLGRYYERSAKAAGSVGAGTDKVIKQYKRVTTLAGIKEFIEGMISSGGTP